MSETANTSDPLAGTYTLHRRQTVAHPIEVVFPFFADAANLDLLTPPWLRFRVLSSLPVDMGNGTRLEYSIRWRGIPTRWLARIEEWVPGRRFVDVQLRGPYNVWHHTHTFESAGGTTIIDDVVRYRLPLGVVGRVAHALLVRRDIEQIFDYRARRIPAVIDRWLRHSPRPEH